MCTPVVVMGVSGCGKTTVGAALADRLRVPFADADDFHSPANIAKMSAGEPLTDDDRLPWLDVLAEWLREHRAGGVLSCSALTRAYRDRLRAGAANTIFVHLDGSMEVIGGRQARRRGHFMPNSLLTSQFAILQPLAPDECGILIDVDREVDAIVAEAVDALAKGCTGGHCSLDS